ncbi:MAG: hypothetical protein HY901_06705 [Deltaproteobacteria bacterium]|nr:hypothetical protein [Deltaproteobacteria bacterium]
MTDNHERLLKRGERIRHLASIDLQCAAFGSGTHRYRWNPPACDADL